jgi:GNAT superfamily N-acetyltransferase
VTIRPFTPDDYPAITALSLAVFPEYPRTEEELRSGDARRDPKCAWSQFVAEEDGRVVGVADYSQSMFMYHPRKFQIFLMVHPDYQMRGIGGRLFDHLRAELVSVDPLALRTSTREDRPESLSFLGNRGFVEEMRHWESHLDVAAFDPTPFTEDARRMTEQGILIKTFPELASDPDHMQKLYDLTTEVGHDVPSPEPHTPIDYAQWLKFFEGPNFLPDGVFVALDGERYVGFSNLFGSQAENHLHTGLTGILNDYRRRGIAMALKLRAVAYARERGAAVIRTENESNNRGMLSINERLGFVKQPAWINLVNVLKEEEEKSA